ncbi:MAG: ABC transporter permease [Clostridiales bacterium]|nr:ABC transporter permease [Clostridiales bacterium]
MGAYAKTILRTIWGNKRISLMLMLITALGAAFFIGLRSAAPDMNITISKYYDRQSMYDIQVISSYGLSGGHIELLRAVQGVSRVEPAYSTDLFAKLGEASYLFKFHSGPPPGSEGDMPAAPLIVSGQMPSQPGECAVSARFSAISGCSLGDTLTLSTGDDTLLADYVSRDTYVITGFVESPLYIRGELGTSKKGSGSLQAYAYIPFNDFTLDIYTEAQIFLANPRKYSRFDERFKQMSAVVEEELQLVGDECAANRRRVLRERALREISQGTVSLTAAREMLAGKESELLEAEFAVLESERELIRQRAALNERILSGRLELESGNAAIITARTTIEQGKLALADAQSTLKAMLSQQNAASAITASPGFSQGAGNSGLSAAADEQARQFMLAQAELIARERELALAEAELEDKQAGLLYGSDVLEGMYYGGLVKLSAAEAELSAARDAFNDGFALFQAEKTSAETQMAASEQKLAAARRTLRAMPEAKCYVLGLDKNANFESFRQDSERVGNIGRVFPLFFFLVAALVAFTCMVRIVEDNRTTAAVMQSLGYSSAKVFAAYLTYALCIGIPGAILGIAVGYRLFPMIVFDYGYRIMYILPLAEKVLYPGLCIMVGAVALISVIVPTVLVSAANTTQVPAALMRPKAPLPGKRILLERFHLIWSRMNFTAKVTARSIVRYKKRFFMTITGIAGCTAIMLTGFGLHDSIMTVADKQFDGIYRYDFIITAAEGRAARSSMERSLISLDEVAGWQYQRRENIDGSLDVKGKSYTATLIVPDDAAYLSDFVKLADSRAGKPISLPDSEVVITQKLASLLRVSAGDGLTLINEDDAEWMVMVGAVTENYVAHYVYMDPLHYAALTGDEPSFTTIVGKAPRLEEGRRDEISKLLLENKGVAALSFNSGTRNFYSDTLNTLNIVVAVLIICGAILAFVVLFCLTGINIAERKREIATLKTLGFFDEEAASYIFRENIVNTVVGVIAGLGFGVLLHQHIIRTVELDMIVFGKVIGPLSYVYATALTFLFTFLVNAAMSGDIKKIDMIESLKSVE